MPRWFRAWRSCGVDLERGAVGLDRLVEPAHLVEGQADVEEPAAVVGVDGDGGAELFEGLLPAALLEELLRLLDPSLGIVPVVHRATPTGPIIHERAQHVDKFSAVRASMRSCTVLRRARSIMRDGRSHACRSKMMIRRSGICAVAAIYARRQARARRRRTNRIRSSRRAPDFTGADGWINTAKPISITDLKGHVVLLDFWTYCCINCMHVFPDLKYLEQKYKDQPFVVIGVHSGKFDQEKDAEHIRNAVLRHNIDHPVAVDSEYKIWNGYGVNSWPTLVLIDPEGQRPRRTVRRRAPRDAGHGHRQGAGNAQGQGHARGQAADVQAGAGNVQVRHAGVSRARCWPTRRANGCSSPTRTITACWSPIWTAR